jgi:glycosyltransferase involved in cell wall biosynthesis
MRVALIVFKGLPVYGIQLANGLSGLAEVHLFLADVAASRYADRVDPGVSLHPIRTRRYRNPAGLLVSLDIISRIRNLRCDVAHLVLNEPWFNVCVPFIRSFPLVTTVHDVRYHVGDRRSSIVPQWVTDLATRYSTGLVVHGAGLKAQVCAEFGISPEHVFNIPHMNYSFYRHWELPGLTERTNNILFFGSIWEYKGLRYLMEAEPLLAEALGGFTITIAGRGEDLAKYRPYMSDPDRYEIINEFVPDRAVAPLFQQASIVVLPYIDASQSGVVPLAFAFGKPVVATGVGSVPEMIDHGVDGLIVEPRDSRALAAAIISILGNPALKRRMSENARRKAETELSWSRVAGLHLDAYAATAERFAATRSRHG